MTSYNEDSKIMYLSRLETTRSNTFELTRIWILGAKRRVVIKLLI